MAELAELAGLTLTTGPYVQPGGCGGRGNCSTESRYRSPWERPTPVDLAFPDEWVAEFASGLLRSDAPQIDSIGLFAETVVAVAS
jgi:hypothetical protein